jgi:uncharacterized protein (DUF849 family)
MDVVAVIWDEQVQAAVDCYNADATVLHLHARNAAACHKSADFDQYSYLLARIKEKTGTKTVGYAPVGT